jgi:hypothetical protein
VDYWFDAQGVFFEAPSPHTPVASSSSLSPASSVPHNLELLCALVACSRALYGEGNPFQHTFQTAVEWALQEGLEHVDIYWELLEPYLPVRTHTVGEASAQRAGVDHSTHSLSQPRETLAASDSDSSAFELI